MFWLPILIGGGIVCALLSDDDDSTSSSSSYDYEADRRRERENQRSNTRNDIASYKSQVKASCRQRFNAEIDFVNNSQVQVSKIDESKIEKCQKENLTLLKALKELEQLKRA